MPMTAGKCTRALASVSVMRRVARAREKDVLQADGAARQENPLVILVS